MTLSSAGKYRLPRTIECKSIALINVILPTSYYNVLETKLQVMKEGNSEVKKFSSGDYNLETLAAKLGKILKVVYEVSVIDSKIQLKGSNDRVNLRFTSYLANLLKLPITIRREAISTSAISLTMSCMYVMSETISLQSFNETSTKILGVIYPSDTKIFHPLFLPTNTHFVDNIDIQLLDPSGNHVVFIGGTPKFVICLRNA